MSQEVLVVGGAGFVGSHLVDRLLERGHEVTVVDNLSSSTLENIQEHLDEGTLNFHEQDVRNKCDELFEGIDSVFHLAGSSDVRSGNESPRKMYENNVRATFNVLEACRKNEVREFVFASSSTVYGEADEIPTPEDHPINPISLYGATKAACESMIKSYANLYDLESTILRYANIFGPRTDHGVMHDFFHKLKDDSEKLEILGNGNQKKSYLYVDDCVDATLHAWRESNDTVSVFNVGSDSQLSVDEIAENIINSMGLDGVEFEYTGGKKGWEGDVPVMMLDTSKIKDLGWKREVGDLEGIERYVKWLEENY